MLHAIVDWCQFTLFDVELKNVFKILNLNFGNFTLLDKGRYGYRNQLKWNDGNLYVMFNSEDDEIGIDTRINAKSGVHVLLTGQGCHQFSIQQNVLDLLRSISALPRVNYSRIDLAIDDYESKILNYNRIRRAAIAGNFTSRWSKWEEITSRKSSNNELLGRTMYFGSNASHLFFRIYDKSLERVANAKGEVIANTDIADVDLNQNWTRLEIVYKKERARKIAEYLVQDDTQIGHAIKGTLKQYVRFLKPSSDANKSRWSSAKWWDTLLSDVDKVKLTVKKQTTTIESMADWVDRQISPTLAAVLTAHDGDLSWLRTVMASGASRLTKKHKDAINQYRHTKGITTNDKNQSILSADRFLLGNFDSGIGTL